MSETLEDIRWRIKVTKDKIRTKQGYIREKRKRIDDLNSAISGIRNTDYCIDSINRYLSTTGNNIENGLGSSYGATDALNAIKEGGSYSDSKINSAVCMLDQEKATINSQVESYENQISSLNYELRLLREREQAKLYEIMQGDI